MITLIFDMDGTILDTIPQYTKIFSQALHKRYNVSTQKSANVYKNTLGEPLDLQFKLAFGEQAFTRKDIEFLIEDFWRLYPRVNIKPMKGAKVTLSELYKKGFNIALSTNVRTDLAIGSLKKVELKEYFVEGLILGYDSNNPEMRKGREHYSIIKEKLKIKGSDVIIGIGDGESDMRIAKEQNAIALGKIGLTTKKKLLETGADITFEKMSDLPGIIENVVEGRENRKQL